jgi:hypothetical protein
MSLIAEVTPQTEKLVEARRERLATAMRERLATALRGEPRKHSATVTLTRYPGLENCGPVPTNYQTVTATSAPLPKAAYSPRPEATPAHGARRQHQRYREDFVSDGTAFQEIHDTVGLGVSRLDPYGAALLAKAGRENSLVEYAGQARPDRAVDILQMLLAADAIDPYATGAVSPAPTVSNRELLQRTSKRQRLILRAFKLVMAGHSWDEAAKILGVPRAEAREMQTFVESRLGRAFSKRPREQKRDHVGRFVKQKTSVTLAE